MDGCDFRKAIISLKNRKTSAYSGKRRQSSQDVSLFWLYGLLFPHSKDFSRNVRVTLDTVIVAEFVGAICVFVSIRLVVAPVV